VGGRKDGRGIGFEGGCSGRRYSTNKRLGGWKHSEILNTILRKKRTNKSQRYRSRWPLGGVRVGHNFWGGGSGGSWGKELFTQENERQPRSKRTGMAKDQGVVEKNGQAFERLLRGVKSTYNITKKRSRCNHL